MSDTPETDDLARGNHVVPTEWAEQLERERDEARKYIERQRLEIVRLNGATNHAGGTPLKIALRERDEARELLRLSSIEANALATSIQKSEYSDVNDFQLCESVAGVISQINNMYAGVREQRDEARESLKHITEYGTEEINAAVELRQKLAQALIERDEAREELQKLEGAYEDATNYYARIIELTDERDETRKEVKYWQELYRTVSVY